MSDYVFMGLTLAVENDIQYVTNVNFLPPYGVVYMDGSALSWVSSNNRYPRIKESWNNISLERLSGFNRVFAKRGSVSTSRGVLKEVGRSLKFWRTFRGNKKKFKSYEWAREYQKTYNILEKGMEFNESWSDLNYKNKVIEFAFGRPNLSLVDRGFICDALLEGNGIGILSADVPLIKSYEIGVRMLGLKKCFVSNAIQARSYFVR